MALNPPPDRHPAHNTFRTSAGAILATAGISIGLGNVWRFPYMVGQFGGAWFVLIYLLAVLAFGIPALMCEWALGRHTRRGPLGAFESVGLRGGRYWGYLLALTVLMAAAYYVVVIGWLLRYWVLFVTGEAALGSQPRELFESWVADASGQLLHVLPCVLVACAALGLGVRR
ncbi:MAG: sodium-dependent transporter, partial [bacterium]|nr:sodium-dependent transporter [bacterium]